MLSVKIMQDECVEYPRDFDHVSTFITFERKYNSPDKNDICSDPADFYLCLAQEIHPYLPDDIAENHLSAIIDKYYIVLPVYKYEHGGVCYNTSGFACLWDSGQAGYIFMRKDVALKEYRTIHDAVKAMQIEVEIFSNWANGEVYYFVIEDDETGETVDSCGGYYGYDECERAANEALAERRNNVD